MSKIEDQFLKQLVDNGFPTPAREYHFHPVRKWRSDFAFPDHKLLVEIEGGAFTRGRHVRGYGYRNDCQKYNNAIMVGFTVLRFTSDMVRSNEAIRTVAVVLNQKGGLSGGRLENILSILPLVVRRRRKRRIAPTRATRQRKSTCNEHKESD